MALLSESEVAEAPASASGKLLKVQECPRPGRTHAEGLWGKKKKKKKVPAVPVLPLRNKDRGTEGSCWPASLLPGGPQNHHRGEECSSEWTRTPQVMLVTWNINNKSWHSDWSCTDHPSFAELQAAEGALCRTWMEILVPRPFMGKQRYPSVLNNKWVDTLQTWRHLYHLSGNVLLKC